MAFKMKGGPYKAHKPGHTKNPQRAKDEKIAAYYARMKKLGHIVNEDGSVTFKKD